MSRRFVRVVLILFIISSGYSCGGDGDGRSSINSEPAVTMEQLYFSPITQIVAHRIKIKTQITYSLYHQEFIPTYPIEALLASPLCICGEEVDKYMPPELRGRGNGNLFIVSNDIRKEFDDSWVEHYYFREQRFERNLIYLLTGTIQYRDWMSPPPLDNPAFISQSNNPVYWSQTFEFRLEKLAVIQE